MRETDGPVLSIGDQYQGTIAALAEQGQSSGRSHQSIRRAGQSSLLAHQDMTPVDLIQKGYLVKTQNAGNVPPHCRGIVSNLIHIGTLPGRHEVGYTESLQRHEATRQPPVSQRL
jgi:hypothetical protein